MKDRGDFEKLWKKPQVVSRLLHFIYDEGHCVTEWAGFRQQYTEVGALRNILTDIPIYVASATLPPPILDKVCSHLQLQAGNTEVIHRSNDRPNINIIVRGLKHAANTYRDLSFLIPENPTLDNPPPKFLVFCDSIKETQEAVEHLWTRVPAAMKEKIRWFHSTMTAQYREEQFEALQNGEIWGLCVTDAFGMVR